MADITKLREALDTSGLDQFARINERIRELIADPPMRSALKRARELAENPPMSKLFAEARRGFEAMTVTPAVMDDLFSKTLDAYPSREKIHSAISRLVADTPLMRESQRLSRAIAQQQQDLAVLERRIAELESDRAAGAAETPEPDDKGPGFVS